VSHCKGVVACRILLVRQAFCLCESCKQNQHIALLMDKMEEKIATRFMLTGSDLLAKVKDLADASKSELVRECGYVSTKKDGSERLNFTAFYEALLEAKGMTLGDGGKGRARPGRELSYMAKVHFNGNLMVGKAYTDQLGLQPGDEFEIKLGRKQIQLVPLGSDVEEEGTAAAA
jgi:hypothetical protein